ncbi:MAG: hypothetical protein HYV20_04320, partial [Gemmatimonadetes bacterium]|nr:hypothetical protein [Gemmatimonadota bacterium]
LVSGGPFASIEAGWQFTCAVATAGNVGHCWGANTKGQLGDGTTTDRLTPTPVKGGADIPFDSMTAAAEHACGVTTTGVGYCWGDNLNGRLGDGTTTARLSPTLITGGLSWVSVSAFDVHSCGVAADNVPYCWGGNGNGQLGDGTTTNRLAPTGISGGPSYPSVMTGNFHTCAVDGLNAAFCWGRNFEGQLGDGTTNQRNVPTAVTGSLLVAAVSPGYLHTCAISAAISASSVVYCWGRNAEGQLGDQTLTQRNAPTRVAGQK